MKESIYHKSNALRVSLVTLIVNFFLSAGKFAVGLFAHSAALMSDAAHSFSDVLSTLVVIIGVRLSSREADEGHPYGHEKLESIAALALSGMLLVTGILIGVESIKGYITGGERAIPGIAALIAAVLSIVVKEWMFHYTRKTALREKSDALMADAWHHRSDALSSVGSFLGVLGARLGFPVLEPIACVLIALLIIKTAVDIFREATNKLVDRALPTEEDEDMKSAALLVPGVISINSFKSRMFGSRIYVDISIGVDNSLTISEAHDIAEAVHDVIETRFPDVKHCMVHEEPHNPCAYPTSKV